MGALPTRDELFDVLLKGKQLEQTMKDRQAGGGAKSGRYKSTTRLDRCLRRVVYPRLKMGILPSATDSKMLFDMPGVYQCLRAAWRAANITTAVHAEPRTATGPSSSWAASSSRRPGASTTSAGASPTSRPRPRPAAIGIVRDASAQTTADDERDALGLAAETLESLAALV
ncbi:hypothetical protein JL720_15934 [Aureococcus anophagefferens]|nr:hypothetical protein JL720_15934 [Aureococcus anophagefferens]